MALINCSNCGKDYSDLLSVCKHCKKSKEIIINSNDSNESLNIKTANVEDDAVGKEWNFKEKAFIVVLIIIIAANFFDFDFIKPKNDNNNLKAKFTECECKEIWKSDLLAKTSNYTDILTCLNLYVWYEKSDGSTPNRENINPCYIEAKKYPENSWIIMLGECDCREGFIQYDRLTNN